jgi:hypothetical protein
MPKDIIIKHDKINHPEKVTKGTVDAFKNAGLDIHRNEVDLIEDDFDRGERRLKVKMPRSFHFFGKNA